MNIQISIHHFLLFSETPEFTIGLLKERLRLLEILPFSNFGFFKSGMLYLKNTYLEIVNYPKDTPAPNSNKKKSRFVGIALQINLSPEKTWNFLQENNINTSEILNEEVLDKEGNKNTIAKIILLNGYLQDFRIFFVFLMNDFFKKKERELENQNTAFFKECTISIKNSEDFTGLLKKLRFDFSDTQTFKTASNQIMKVVDTESNSTEINSFFIDVDGELINILEG